MGTKPKKIKHKRKKVKLAVLKFYKVDSNDKVTKLRRDCPHEICGSGVFMAMHFNRYYCGKCHLTYLIKRLSDEVVHCGSTLDVHAEELVATRSGRCDFSLRVRERTWKQSRQ